MIRWQLEWTWQRNVYLQAPRLGIAWSLGLISRTAAGSSRQHLHRVLPSMWFPIHWASFRASSGFEWCHPNFKTNRVPTQQDFSTNTVLYEVGNQVRKYDVLRYHREFVLSLSFLHGQLQVVTVSWISTSGLYNVSIFESISIYHSCILNLFIFFLKSHHIILHFHCYYQSQSSLRGQTGRSIDCCAFWGYEVLRFANFRLLVIFSELKKTSSSDTRVVGVSSSLPSLTSINQ